MYIFRKQLEEADVLVLSKADTLAPEKLAALMDRIAEIAPRAARVIVSSQTGDGIDEWLATVLGGADAPAAGQADLNLDYEVYAQGEAALGWLNAAVELAPGASGDPVDWRAFGESFLRDLQGELRRRRAHVGHAKLTLHAPSGRLTLNLTDVEGDVEVRGAMEPTEQKEQPEADHNQPKRFH